MNANHKLEMYFFGYGLAVFPLLLLVGSPSLEIFLVSTVLYPCYFFIKKKNFHLRIINILNYSLDNFYGKITK